MLRLSKKADYALMAMKHLAVKTDVASTSAREIAEQYDIPVELMAKVLQRLARSGLLTSHQGTRGGYTLSKPTASISVADIIQAIDGPLTVTACPTETDAPMPVAKTRIASDVATLPSPVASCIVKLFGRTDVTTPGAETTRPTSGETCDAPCTS